MTTWQQYPRGSARLTVGQYEADVWPTGGGTAHFTVLDTVSGQYIAGGARFGVANAKQAAWLECIRAAARTGGFGTGPGYLARRHNNGV